MPIPFIRGRVGDREGWFLIDTGAGAHVLAESFVQAAGIPMRASDVSVRGQGGRKTGGIAALADMDRCSLDGWGSLSGQTAVVIPTDPAIEQAVGEGLAGYINPQLLVHASGTAVVLDFPGRRMEEIPQLTLPAPGPGPRLVLQPAFVCSDKAAPLPNLHLLVRASVASEELWLTVDSGGTSTTIYAESSAAKALLASNPATTNDEPGVGAGGEFATQRVEGAELSIGELRSRLPLTLQPGGPGGECPSSGHLGVDILSRCVIALSATAVAGVCAAP